VIRWPRVRAEAAPAGTAQFSGPGRDPRYSRERGNLAHRFAACDIIRVVLKYWITWKRVGGNDTFRNCVLAIGLAEAFDISRAVVQLSLGPNFECWELSKVEEQSLGSQIVRRRVWEFPQPSESARTSTAAPRSASKPGS
jgi:hypothetical protein